MKKNLKNFFTIFFILYQKIPLVSSLENSPYLIFFPKDDRATIIYNFLLLRPCTLFVLQTSQNCFGIFIRLVLALFKFGIGNIICHDPTASSNHGALVIKLQFLGVCNCKKKNLKPKKPSSQLASAKKWEFDFRKRFSIKSSKNSTTYFTYYPQTKIVSLRFHNWLF